MSLNRSRETPNQTHNTGFIPCFYLQQHRAITFPHGRHGAKSSRLTNESFPKNALVMFPAALWGVREALVIRFLRIVSPEDSLPPRPGEDCI